MQVVAELMPYSGGLKRNIVQCLDDFVIPLKLSHTVVDIKGRERVEGITLAQVDEHNKPIEERRSFTSATRFYSHADSFRKMRFQKQPV